MNKRVSLLYFGAKDSTAKSIKEIIHGVGLFMEISKRTKKAG